MAAPVVDSVTPSSVTLKPGEHADVVIVAHDPDSKSGSGRVTIVDSGGSSVDATVAIQINDPITFGPASNPDNLAVTITKIADDGKQATYRIQA